MDKSYTDFSKEFINPIKLELQERLRKLESVGEICRRCEPWLVEWLLANKQKRRKRTKENEGELMHNRGIGHTG